MSVAFFFILDLFTVFTATMQAQLVNRHKNIQQPPKSFQSTNYGHLHAHQLPAIASVNYKSPCGFSCDEKARKYLAYYEPSSIIFPNDINYYPERERKIVDWTSTRNAKKSRKAGKSAGKSRENENDFPAVPATYLRPPSPTASDFHFYANKENSRTPRRNATKVENVFPTPETDHFNNRESKETTEKSAPIYVRDHAPASREEDASETSGFEAVQRLDESTTRNNNSLELSPDGDRVEFQIRGHDGPRSYIFGFDTGDGKNRQYRLEERLKNGTVKGHYGYYDARGKLRTVKYVARPLEGYEEKHHEANTLKPSQ